MTVSLLNSLVFWFFLNSCIYDWTDFKQYASGLPHHPVGTLGVVFSFNYKVCIQSFAKKKVRKSRLRKLMSIFLKTAEKAQIGEISFSRFSSLVGTSSRPNDSLLTPFPYLLRTFPGVAGGATHPGFGYPLQNRLPELWL